jgi:YHS domain-containing protein
LRCTASTSADERNSDAKLSKSAAVDRRPDEGAIMTNTLFRFLLPLVLAMLCAITSVAWAGEYFEKDGVAVRGHDPVAYFKDGKPARGSAEHRFVHKGSTFHFASKANRDAFAAEPERYAPQYGGFCAFGMASGYKAAIDPAAFTVREGKLYLNYSRDVQRQWSADIPGHLARADRHWPAVSKQTKVIE